MARTPLYDREAAVEAATALFWEKGFVGTSLKDLEQALDMKPGSIYAAFKSKEALFLLALEKYFIQGVELMDSLYDKSASTISSLCNMLTHIGNSGKNDPLSKPCMIVKTLIESKSTPDDIVQKAQHYHGLMLERFQIMFENARYDGEIRPELDTEKLARKFQSNVTALRIEAYLNDDTTSVQSLAEIMVEDLEKLRLVH